MTWMLRVVLAAIVTAGLAYGGYEAWPLMEDEIKGTFVSDFKYLPIILVFFLVLSVLDAVAVRIERMFSSDSKG